jgi:Zn-dependent protease with chaperone function
MMQSGGDRQPAFISTHPDPSNRIEHLKEVMLKAMEH